MNGNKVEKSCFQSARPFFCLCSDKIQLKTVPGHLYLAAHEDLHSMRNSVLAFPVLRGKKWYKNRIRFELMYVKKNKYISFLM